EMSESALQIRVAQRVEGQLQELQHPVADRLSSELESLPPGFLASRRVGRIGIAPVHLDRAARPERTGLYGGAVAHRDHDPHARRRFAREFVPALAPIALGVDAGALQRLESEGIDAPARR